MENVAFLSIDSLTGFKSYDHLLVEPFKHCGWRAETVSWHAKDVDWDTFDTVIIRSCWDYHKHAQRFLYTLRQIENSSAALVNSLDLVQWNINKKYLKDLRAQHVPIVSTLWNDELKLADMDGFFSTFNTDEIVIKPAVGAGSDDTFRISKKETNSVYKDIKTSLNGRAFLVQPFIKNIVSEGEYSLFYFNDRYSHTVLKTPKSGDFRVQEEHGGRLQTIEANQAMLQVAESVREVLPQRPLYNRIDLVRNNNSFLVMEIELIEPSLYFNMDPESPQRFVKAFLEWRADIN